MVTTTYVDDEELEHLIRDIDAAPDTYEVVFFGCDRADLRAMAEELLAHRLNLQQKGWALYRIERDGDQS